MTRFYFAPLEGVTDPIYRRIHHNMFGGVTKYFIPFVSPTSHLTFSSREQASISPLENAGIPAVPQILTRNAAHFTEMTRLLADAGFSEVNLNLGCPSGTVTGKGKGSGLLRDPDALKAFLDEVFSNAALPVSVKTRIGFESADEWPRLLAIFRAYPMSELIVHPRTRSQFYKGVARREECARVFEGAHAPFVYNGDLFTADDCARLARLYPETHALMLGRGLVANPALAQEASGGEALTRAAARAFHDQLLRAYTEKWPPNAVLGHMHEIMYYMTRLFENAEKPAKLIRKSASLKAYEDAVRLLFDVCPLRENAGFVPYD